MGCDTGLIKPKQNGCEQSFGAQDTRTDSGIDKGNSDVSTGLQERMSAFPF